MATRAPALMVAGTLAAVLCAPPDVNAQTARTGGAANAELMQQLQQAGLQDKVTFMSLNVFGLTAGV
jgi:hypothetical protein